MYTLEGHGKMLADRVRVQAYAQALRQTIQPDSVVLDLGTGTGIFALLACRLAARCVYAVEPDDIIQVARENAAANGCAQRIEFIQDVAARVTLPHRADVIVSDLRGVLPWEQHHLTSVAAARRHLLAPGGILIPQQDCVWASVVQAPQLYRRLVEPWDDNCCGLRMPAARRMATNSWRKARVTSEELLTEPQCLATLDYSTLENPNLDQALTWSVPRAGTGHGFVVWFDTILAQGVQLSNSPFAPELIYGSAFFPWPEPVSLGPRDTVSVSFTAKLLGENYVWRWATCVRTAPSSGRIKNRFEQSTLFGAPLSLAGLRKSAANYVPALTDDGRIEQMILELMDSQTPLGEIARRVAQRFPDRFGRCENALARVSEIAQMYSQ